ncbi:fused (3R)-hydroxyacyl-ACP dehydratase subunits HadA/HadB [Nocardia anaemiae]|uniref:fused (3R)-hydroxyacyl-ACP dehydratase subunits HadA/HadB n=1 Tax=Nocardia anaemiae TaxID=263910 RepID=UPI0007A4183A|nr:fused (3R)-hydroxyacyl-ACP dehydratase subunits HadA/HadB [Nocardia anaemiae]
MNNSAVDAATDPADQARALLDHRYRSATTYEVRREKIREFARAIQDFHPAHWNEEAAAQLGFGGLIAPPTFASIILLRIHREILDTLITGYEAHRILHADQVLDIGRPLVAGDRITCDVYFESFQHFAQYDVLAVKSVLTDQHGDVVQTGSTALLARTGRENAGSAERLGAHTPIAPHTPGVVVPAEDDGIVAPISPRTPCTTVDFESLSVGTELPARVVQLSRGDLVDYAGVTGDADPVLFSEQAATATGLPTVVAPGMFKLGLAAGYLSGWLGDPAAATRFRAQFAHHTHYLHIPPLQASAIEFHGRITSLDPHRRMATVALDARAHGRRLFGYAAAEVRFTERD